MLQCLLMGDTSAPQPLSLSVFFLKFIFAALGLSYGS